MWRTFRQVFFLQVVSTMALALISAWFSGAHGAVSAALGGSISIIAGLAFVALAARSKGRVAGEVLLTAFRAEAAKISLVVILLWLVLTNYREVVVLALIASFAVSILIFSMALFVKDKT